LFEGAASRTEIVVTFLALLELIRLKKVRVTQSEAFGEIDILRLQAEAAISATEPVINPEPQS
jgi:segregation and condensation protein A